MVPTNKNLSIDDLLILSIEDISLESLVEKKLRFSLQNEPDFEQDFFKNFYNPIEQALVEFCLDAFQGNQTRVANLLEINRNTLKKKIEIYDIHIKDLLEKSLFSKPLNKHIYIGPLSRLNLLEISRTKLINLKTSENFKNQNLFKTIALPVEQAILKTTLHFFKNNYLKTSQALNINRSTLKKRIDLSYSDKEKSL